MSASVTLIRAAQLASAPYAYAALPVADARLLFLAGACPLDASGATVGVGNVAEQTARAMDNLITALGAAGAGLADLIHTRVLVASSCQEDLATAWAMVRARLGDHEPPSTLVGVTVLGYPDQLVEIEAVAAVRD